jgi:hypothetical protein
MVRGRKERWQRYAALRMTITAEDRRPMRMLAVILTVLWAVTAVVIATAYRPGGPVDIAVALACFIPVVIADMGVIWPAKKMQRSHRLALVWVWIGAVLFTLPIAYGVATTLTTDGPQGLVPSVEAAYAGGIALFLTSFYSVVGIVHRRRGVRPLQPRASALAVLAAVGLTIVAGLAFLFVAAVNERDVRVEAPASSAFGPTDPDAVPPDCDQPPALGSSARVVIRAKSSLDNTDRGTAILEGRRDGLDESWGGSWEGVDGSGQQAYLRVGRLAWLNDTTDDPQAPARTWRTVQPDPFDLRGTAELTMDGPPYAIASAPRGEIVPEDLGLEHVEGAAARHCRTYIDGTTALDTFLPLRWLLFDGDGRPEGAISRWRGELDWWVFTDGELGLAAVEVSGPLAETPLDDEGVRVVLEAELSATHRDETVDVTAPRASVPLAASASPDATGRERPATGLDGDAEERTLESEAP